MPLLAQIGQPITFKELGLKFDITAPYSGCRLCGAVYQSDLDRALGRTVQLNLVPDIGLVQQANDRRERWRELHTKRYHTSQEVEAFEKTGLTLTPEAANKMAPLGIIPMDFIDNQSKEIAAALLEAPRAPYNDVEGT